MKTNVLILLFFITSISFSQKPIDSLTLLLKQAPESNSERLEILNELGYFYSQIDTKKGLEISDEAILLAKKLDLQDELAIAYKNKGINYKTKGLDSLAFIMYDKAFKIFVHKNNQKGVGDIIYNKGLIYFEKSDYNLSNECNIQAYDIFKKLNDSLSMAKALRRLGVGNMYLTKYSEALSNYLEASKIYEAVAVTDKYGYAGNNSNIAILYKRLGNIIQAVVYENKALKVFKEINNQKGIANSLSNLANIYDDLGQSLHAISLYNEAFKIMESIGDESGMASSLSNIGIAYTTLLDYEEALKYLNQTKIIYSKLNNYNNLSIVYKYIGLCYFNSPKQNQLIKARENFEKSLEYAQKAGSINLQVSALEYIVLMHEKHGDYKRAYELKNQWVSLRDIYNSNEKKEEIVRIEAQHEYEKKEAVLRMEHDKEKAISESQIQHQKFITKTSIIGGSCFILVSIIGFILYRKKQQSIAKAKEAEFKTKVANTELKVLRSQINPHFIFNALNSINKFISNNKASLASIYLLKFSKLMRKTLEYLQKEDITLKEDTQLLKTYLEIENKRFEKQFNFNIEIDDKIDENNVLVPPMIIQPFVENSIWHGISKLEDRTGDIFVQVKKEDNNIIYSVDDNGVGRTSSKSSSAFKKDSESLGIKITKSRIDIINKRKKTNASLNIIDKDIGTRVEVILPINLAYEYD